MKPYSYMLLPVLVLLFFLSIVSKTVAQEDVQFFLKNESVITGNILEADVQVINFRRIVGASFTVRWDSMHLRYVGLSNLALDLSPQNNNFGLTQVSGGVLPFLMIDNSLNGFTLPDSTILFTVRLEAIAPAVTNTEVIFSSQPTPQEVSDTTFEAIPVQFINGNITINSITSTNEIAVDAPLSVTASPNPFAAQTQVLWHQQQSAQVNMSIYDLSGKLIYQQEKEYSTGEHRQVLNRELFPQAGTYYLQLRAGEHVQTQRLVVVGQ